MKDLEEEVEDIGNDFEALENLANSQGRNNLRIRGLKEKTGGQDLSDYLTDFFSRWLGSDSEVDITISAAFQVG